MATFPTPQRRLTFDHFEMDLTSGQLSKNGRKLRLQPQPFRLLEMLATRPNEIVTREEICQTLWGCDTFVEFDHSLGTAINKIREALGDSADKPRFVETLPRRGYRFIGAVETQFSGEKLTSARATPSSLHAPSETVETSKPATLAGPSDGRAAWFKLAAGLTIGVLSILMVLAAYRSTPKNAVRSASALLPFTDYPGIESCPSFSPDGSRISFAWDGGVRDDASSSNLYVKGIGSETLLRLTQQPSKAVCGTWSPDGTQIAIRRTAGDDSGIYLIPALGGPEQKLLSTRTTGELSWSADGKLLAYSDSVTPGDPQRIFVLSLSTLEKSPIPHNPGCLQELQPAFAHSRNILAFICLLKANDNKIGVFTTTLAGEAPKLIIEFMTGWGLSAGIAWTADDKRLIVSRPTLGIDYELDDVEVQNGSFRKVSAGTWPMQPTLAVQGGRLAFVNFSAHVNIWRRDLLHPGTAPVKLIASIYDQSSPSYSPDGKHLVFCSNRGGDWEIWMGDADGTHLVRLSDSKTSHAGSPRWSPDSQKIAFDSRKSELSEVDVVDISDRVPHKLLTNLSEISTPSWSQDGRWIYFQSTSNTKIFRCPSTGGDAEPLTGTPGSNPLESFDGESVNFYSAASGKLQAVSLSPGGGTREIEGMPAVKDQSQYTPVAGGIYYVPAEAPKSVWYFDLATRKNKKVFETEYYHNNSLSVSHNRRWILYTQIDRRSSNIMLLENFN